MFNCKDFESNNIERLHDKSFSILLQNKYCQHCLSLKILVRSVLETYDVYDPCPH